MAALTFTTPTTGRFAVVVASWVVRRPSFGKPSVFCEMIESHFPTLPKVELHARGVVSRPGWEVWGLEAPASGEIRHAESAADDRDESAINHAA
jgi:N6-adenosine-specific RNA methylase IME4